MHCRRDNRVLYTPIEQGPGSRSVPAVEKRVRGPMACAQDVAIGFGKMDVPAGCRDAGSGANMSRSSMFMWKVSTII